MSRTITISESSENCTDNSELASYPLKISLYTPTIRSGVLASPSLVGSSPISIINSLISFFTFSSSI